MVAVTILSSDKNIKLDPTLIWREVGFYILSTLVIIIFAIIGTLDIFSAILMLSLYVTMVLVVFIQDRIKKVYTHPSHLAQKNGGIIINS